MSIAGPAGTSGTSTAALRHLRLEIPPPTRVTMTVQLPQLRLSTQLPAVRIDVRRSLEELGLERQLTLAREYAQRGRQAALRETARAAREGDMLRDVHRGFDLIELTAQRGQPRIPQLNVDVAPKTPVAIDVARGSVQVDLQPGTVDIRVPFELVKVYLEEASRRA